jgi:hypothetical protein
MFGMNIYLCSTVRNLLFALLKSLNEPQQSSCILLICDQQDIDKENYDPSILPKNIRIRFIRRKDIRARLDKSISGRFLRLAAALNITTSERFRQRIRLRIFNEIIQLEEPTQSEVSRLFLFNDRNRVARLLRLAFADYAVIEDGLSNYSGTKLKPLERIRNRLVGNTAEMRYLGDDRRCREIFLLKPQDAPQALKHKTKPVSFIKHKNITEFCYGFFRYQPSDVEVENQPCLLATQPISIGKLTSSGFDLVIYRKLIQKLRDKGINPLLKVHPRESITRYLQAFPESPVAESKIPLELLIFGAKEKSDIVSIYSTAGMGFENYCRRLTLIRQEESEKMEAIFNQWREDESLLDQRIEWLLR